MAMVETLKQADRVPAETLPAPLVQANALEADHLQTWFYTRGGIVKAVDDFAVNRRFVTAAKRVCVLMIRGGACPSPHQRGASSGQVRPEGGSR